MNRNHLIAGIAAVAIIAAVLILSQRQPATDSASTSTATPGIGGILASSLSFPFVVTV